MPRHFHVNKTIPGTCAKSSEVTGVGFGSKTVLKLGEGSDGDLSGVPTVSAQMTGGISCLLQEYLYFKGN